jgi:uncharacterized membrane protein SirB2
MIFLLGLEKNMFTWTLLKITHLYPYNVEWMNIKILCNEHYILLSLFITQKSGYINLNSLTVFDT